MGVNWAGKSGPVTPKGAPGWGVQLLDELAATGDKIGGVSFLVKNLF